MNTKIDTVSGRARLKARRDPYWQRTNRGLFIGFRKMTDNTDGTWVVRYRADNEKQLRHTLGTLEQFPASERFDQATVAAKEWLSHLDSGGSNDSCTVMDACNAYVKKIQELKGEKPALDLEARYRRWVQCDPIQEIEIRKLTRDHVRAFRRRMVAAPVKIGNSETRERSKDTVNRDIAAVRAALNQALQDGKTTTDFSWRQPLAAFKNVSKRREVYLDREQRKKFINHAPTDLARFIRCLCMLPLRPGALAALTVADIDVRVGVLRIGKDKSGKDRRLKLPPEIASYLESDVQNRPASAPLLARQDGTAWNKDSWKKPMKAAAVAAGLPDGTIAYALRHSAISDLVHGGLDLLTVAQISGTSVAMIERHYGHLRSDVASSALSKLVL